MADAPTGATAVDLRDVACYPATPEAECDVVMKGGITSGVVYPRAICELARHYRLRSIGGASAGAIGAAIGAAAEYARDDGGFARLAGLPDSLAGGKLAGLFQPQPSTAPLLQVMLAATGNDKPATGGESSKPGVVHIVLAVIAAFRVAALVGAVPGVVLAVVGVLTRGLAGWLLTLTGVALAVVGLAVAVAWRAYRTLTVAVPDNMFGICTGVGRDPDDPAFTTWLSQSIDMVAGLDPGAGPLRFGQLWRGRDGSAPPAGTGDRHIDLRMITTCLTQGRPFEMPWEANTFFYAPSEWAKLFPPDVLAALTPAVPTGSPAVVAELSWEDALAAAHPSGLQRLPAAGDLPVIVAVRLSLSFPLLISAVPLWSIDRRSPANRAAAAAFAAWRRAGSPDDGRPDGLVFERVWFTDGGFCNNFPVHLFDSPLPTRPTFAINLGRFADGVDPDADQRKNVEWARTNNSQILPQWTRIPERGVPSVIGFGSAAFNSARNWYDSSQLTYPGYRDRTVRVLQTKREGGLNLHMESSTIDGLAERGRVAAEVMHDQFSQPHYHRDDPAGPFTATGWDNHRWVRYRALLSVLPDWLAGFRAGYGLLGVDPADPPSYPLSLETQELAGKIALALDAVATVVSDAPSDAVNQLTGQPRPRGRLRRTPDL